MTLLAILLPGIAGLGLWWWASQHWRANEPLVIAGVGALVVLLLVLSAGLWHRGRQLEAARSNIRAGALVRDSLEAVADTIRVHALDSTRAVYERRALQVEAERDSVDQLLGTERRSVARLEAEVREMETTAGGTVTLDSIRPEVRLVESQVREPPFTVRIRGEVWPDTAELAVRVQVDPVALEVAFRCGAPRETGVRPAHVTVEGPDWLRISDVRGEMDPAACNPPPYSPGLLERLEIAAPYAGGALVLGVVLGLVAR